MISCGANILGNADPLKKITLDYFFNSIRFPNSDVEARIRHLRVIRQLDAVQYANIKRQLPYIVCGIFNPPFRRTINFAFTENFILDIDHIAEKGLELATVRKSVQQDPRVQMCFLSPGEDGLKVMLGLKERCYDPALYSLFYKAFLRDFSIRHHLEAVADNRTSDVCRACFMSVDPQAYFNPNAEPVDMATVVDQNDPSALSELGRQLKAEEKEHSEEHGLPVPNPAERISTDPDKETMDRIKGLLNDKKKPEVQLSDVFVPGQIKSLLGELEKFLELQGITVDGMVDISYGEKIRMRLGQRFAEINLFYGKKGFTIVQSPKKGVSAELNELCKGLIALFLREGGYA